MSDYLSNVGMFSSIKAALPQKPFDVLGIVDNYGAVHGFPRWVAKETAILTHEDLFGACHKRWRYTPGKGFQQVPGTEGEEKYTLDAEEKGHVLEFLRRRGWV